MSQWPHTVSTLSSSWSTSTTRFIFWYVTDGSESIYVYMKTPLCLCKQLEQPVMKPTSATLDKLASIYAVCWLLFSGISQAAIDCYSHWLPWWVWNLEYYLSSLILGPSHLVQWYIHKKLPSISLLLSSQNGSKSLDRNYFSALPGKLKDWMWHLLHTKHVFYQWDWSHENMLNREGWHTSECTDWETLRKQVMKTYIL